MLGKDNVTEGVKKVDGKILPRGKTETPASSRKEMNRAAASGFQRGVVVEKYRGQNCGREEKTKSGFGSPQR